MEIWVRSQDKEQLVKTNDFRYKREEKKKTKPFGDFEEARLFCDYDIVEKHYIYSDRFDILGEYPTKERCLEIIDEIQSLFCDFLICKDIDPCAHENFQKFGIVGAQYLGKDFEPKVEYHERSSIVYEMPRE
jgi:hypothetical protein